MRMPFSYRKISLHVSVPFFSQTEEKDSSMYNYNHQETKWL
ncbi:Uncharacterised protein [Prevotella denticola]|uniref:Uncharacterized protein n=1 Tax=Prevotella denticola TaxID=28129 RepID=A0A379EDX3_9BACT|nr:Uncharacterised protein [Prevotella denticola]